MCLFPDPPVTWVNNGWTSTSDKSMGMKWYDDDDDDGRSSPISPMADFWPDVSFRFVLFYVCDFKMRKVICHSGYGYSMLA